MKVAVIAATGKTGVRVQDELVSRGHEVVAIVRSPEKAKQAAGVTMKKSDLSDVAQIASTLQGVDAVVSAYGPPVDDTDQIIGVTDRIVEAVKQAGAGRLIVVGGAGGLFVAPGVTLHESGYLPAAYLPISGSHIKTLENLKKSGIDWTYFAPAAYFEPGEKTGKFRLGKDDLLSDASGTSKISMEDYAIALVDELEKPQHQKARFTAAY